MKSQTAALLQNLTRILDEAVDDITTLSLAVEDRQIELETEGGQSPGVLLANFDAEMLAARDSIRDAQRLLKPTEGDRLRRLREQLDPTMARHPRRAAS